MGNDPCTLGVQQWYNNKTHWGWTYILGLIPMCLVVVPLLYSVSVLIISLYIYVVRPVPHMRKRQWRAKWPFTNKEEKKGSPTPFPLKKNGSREPYSSSFQRRAEKRDGFCRKITIYEDQPSKLKSDFGNVILALGSTFLPIVFK